MVDLTAVHGLNTTSVSLNYRSGSMEHGEYECPLYDRQQLDQSEVDLKHASPTSTTRVILPNVLISYIHCELFFSIIHHCRCAFFVVQSSGVIPVRSNG